MRSLLEIIAFILITVLALSFSYWASWATGRPGLAFPVLMVWVWFLAIFTKRETKRETKIRAFRGATSEETSLFQPTRYYRMKRRRGWRDIEIDVDDAIEIPNVEVIPVQELGVRLPYSMGVVFEYRGQLFYGVMC